MNRKIKFILLIIFSLWIIGATPYKQSLALNSFDLIEEGIVTNNDFVQNGVKVEYYSDLSLKEEYQRILEIINQNDNKNLELENNKIIYKDVNKDISITLWQERNQSKIEIIYINNSIGKLSFEIREELSKFINGNSSDIKYNSFVKVKLLKEIEADIKEVLEDNILVDTLEILEIYNGHVAKANLRDNQKVNLGIMKYDTGEYLVIGTPVIFVTY